MIKIAKRVVFNATHRTGETVQGRTWILDVHAKGDENVLAEFSLWILDKCEGALMVYEDDFEAMKIREVFSRQKFLRLPALTSAKTLADYLMKTATGTFPNAQVFALTLSQGDDPNVAVTITLD